MEHRVYFAAPVYFGVLFYLCFRTPDAARNTNGVDIFLPAGGGRPYAACTPGYSGGGNRNAVCRLPSELTSDDMLCVYSNELLGRIQVDGADAASFGAEAHLSEPGGNFYFFPLDAEQAGKAIRIDAAICHSSFPDAKLGVWVGAMAEIMDGVWEHCLVSACLILVVGILGLISIVLGYCYRPHAGERVYPVCRGRSARARILGWTSTGAASVYHSQ